MDESQIRQQAYFDRIASEFDGHYATKKGPWEMAIDRIFRQGMVQRWDYVTGRTDWAGHTVIDIGCGPGRYMAAFVGRGARRVTGIDFAASMIAIARRNLEAVGAIDKCDLVVGDFLSATFDGTFDTVVAIGYFDYILGRAALDDHFGRMWKLANRRVVASFPYRWSFKTFPRWAWLTARGCPVQFFSVPDVEALMQRLAIAKYTVERMSGTILVIAEKQETRA